jgi:tetratricopeptide (TPR) repeat protein
MTTIHQRNQAKKLVNLASDLEKDEKVEEAIATLLKAIELDPSYSVPYYNLGLTYKYQHNWEKSLYFNQKSAQLNPQDQPSLWNLGIAATALRDWKTARSAWKSFGIPIPDAPETSEILMPIGITPVRLIENREVIWTDRIDPARAIIHNIPTAASNRRYNDIVLNDGAPNGFRTHNGREYPVFDELELFQASDYQTFSVAVSIANPSALGTLENLCDQKKIGFENWTDSLRSVCKQCSEGTPHQHHDKALEKNKIQGSYQLGMAAKSESDLNQLLREWLRYAKADLLGKERLM